MSTLVNEYKMTQYQTIHSLDKSGKVELVRNITNNNFFIKKTHDNYNIQVYESIMKNPHPNVVFHYDYFIHNYQLITIEEFINGFTLQEFYEANSPLNEDTVRTIILQVCDGLKHLHSLNSPIIHRDIKLTNIMIDSNKNIKLIDFNIARLYDNVQNADTVILGTAGFAAPEQFGFQQTDARTDIYAVGILMNYLLVGVPPQKHLYKGSLGKVIMKCIQIDPDKRYQNIERLESDIQKEDKKKKITYYPILMMRSIIFISGLWAGYSHIISETKTAFPFSIFERFILLTGTILVTTFMSNFLNIFSYLPFCSSKKIGIRIFGYFFYMFILIFLFSNLFDLIVMIEAWM